MKTEEEILEKIKTNEERMRGDRISQSVYTALSEQTATLKWVLR